MLVSAAALLAAVPASRELRPNLEGRMEHPLRYTPEGSDFVLVRGREFFNRPLYGGNTAFRVDTGDLPEFVLYLPGRGGNLRLGIVRDGQARWLHALDEVGARYRPGAMLHEIRDPAMLGPEGVLRLTAVSPRDFEGLLLRLEAEAVPEALELFWAFGGLSGERGVRDGDIGTERVPISEWFQLRPEFAEGNRPALAGSSFRLRAAAGEVVGAFPRGTRLHLASSEDWNAPDRLLAGADAENAPARPVVVGRLPLPGGEVLHFGLQHLSQGSRAAAELPTYREVGAPVVEAARESAPPLRIEPDAIPALFLAAEHARAAVAAQLRVETPDPYLDAAVAALCIAADAVWDEPQGAVMHGAIAWRSRLLGWRGPYAMDALGWHDRARRHLAYWATRQNLEPIPEGHAPPEEATNLARMRTALHTRGDMAGSHYDMNLVYIDALFRHLRWTGDLAFAAEIWPTIERHLAWERRLFRREFGPERLPLYEAYAAIWASDDLQYHGGGVAYTSAYNYWHNLEAARLARLLGHDGDPYEAEATRLAEAMRRLLWMPEAGMFAEFKDLLGEQHLHPAAGLWSFYHLMDAALPTAEEALAMTRWVDAHQPRLPVLGPGVPPDAAHHLWSTTNWMPYTWSVNNVTMNENVHAALGFWQAGRADAAYTVLRGSLLASMYMGICPGNVGSMNYLDVYRRESQRDFADGSGVLSRAVVEGLFGLRPDLLDGVLVFAPGLPRDWSRARLEHAGITLDFTRDGARDRYTVASRLATPVSLEVRLPALFSRATVRVQGERVEARLDAGAPIPVLTFSAAPAAAWDLEIEWEGEPLTLEPSSPLWPGPEEAHIPGVSGIDWSRALADGRRLETLDLRDAFNDPVTAIFQPGKYRSPRSPGVSLAIPAQGIGAWAGHVQAMAEIDDSGLRALGGTLVLPNGVRFATPAEAGAANAAFVSHWDNYPRSLTVPLAGRAHRLFLLMAGSTNHMQSRLENGTVRVRYADGGEARLPLVNPTNWWPIEQDYFIDDYQFRRPGPLPPRVDLRTGTVRILEEEAFKGRGRAVPGGAATVLALPLDPARNLHSLTLEARANEVIIGLMAATLER
jgi:hypothetical protein